MSSKFKNTFTSFEELGENFSGSSSVDKKNSKEAGRKNIKKEILQKLSNDQVVALKTKRDKIDKAKERLEKESTNKNKGITTEKLVDKIFQSLAKKDFIVNLNGKDKKIEIDRKIKINNLEYKVIGFRTAKKNNMLLIRLEKTTGDEKEIKEMDSENFKKEWDKGYLKIINTKEETKEELNSLPETKKAVFEKTESPSILKEDIFKNIKKGERFFYKGEINKGIYVVLERPTKKNDFKFVFETEKNKIKIKITPEKLKEILLSDILSSINNKSILEMYGKQDEIVKKDTIVETKKQEPIPTIEVQDSFDYVKELEEANKKIVANINKTADDFLNAKKEEEKIEEFETKEKEEVSEDFVSIDGTNFYKAESVELAKLQLKQKREAYLQKKYEKKSLWKKTLSIFGDNENEKIKNPEEEYLKSKRDYLEATGKDIFDFITEEKEEINKYKIENGGFSERIKNGIQKGIEKWDNWDNKYAKTAVKIALVGAVSSGVVLSAGALGIGSSAALSAGITSYIGKKALMALALTGATEKITSYVPEKHRHWVNKTMLGASIGMSAFSPAGIATLASITGVYAAKSFIKSEKSIQETLDEKIKELKKDTLSETVGGIDENRLAEIEAEYSKIHREAEKQRIYRKLASGAIALASSVTTLEMSGYIHTPIAEASGTPGISVYSESAHPNREDFENTNSHNLYEFKHGEKVEAPAEKEINKEIIKEQEPTIKTENTNNETNTQENQKEIIIEEKPIFEKEETIENTENHNENEIALTETPEIKTNSTEYTLDDDSTYQENVNIDTNEQNLNVKLDEDTPSPEFAQNNTAEINTQNDTGMTDEKYTEEFTKHENSTQHTENEFNKMTPEERLESRTPEVKEAMEGATKQAENYKNDNDEVYAKNDEIKISEELTEKINKSYTNSINHIFEERPIAWEAIKDDSAMKMLSNENHLPEKEPFISYLKYMHKLQDVTELQPRSESLLQRAETSEEFIKRALQKAAEIGKLNKVKF
ncbi:hypothetical protein K8Q94_03615 [Candidatus Nomurabacteria bacterium]|nr:hypothetical protein [Candidatus Nomurabacteria bacterium]